MAKCQANTALNHGGETLQRWQAVGDTVSNLNSLERIKLQTSHTEGDASMEKNLSLIHRIDK